MKVVTLYSTSLAPNVARDLNTDLIKPSYDTFSDGEPHIRFGRKFESEEVLFIQNTFPHQDRKLHEIYFAVETLKKGLSAKRVTAVIPYLAYMRQNKDFAQEKGVGYNTVCARVVLNNLKNCGIDKLYTVDIHCKELIKEKDYAGFVENLDPSHLFAQHLVEREIKETLGDLLVAAADDNAESKAKKISELLDAKYLILNKERCVDGKTKTKDLASNLPTENVVIVDDIIATGDTMAGDARVLRKAGAKKILAVCTHAIMAGGSEKTLKNEGISEVISTDSIESHITYISPSFLTRISLSPLISHLFKS